MILLKKESVVQCHGLSLKKTRMKYSKEGSRVFVPYQYDEMTIENIKEVCKTFSSENGL